MTLMMRTHFGVIAALSLHAAGLGACAGSRPASETARRVALSLDSSEEEHSKDSHGRRAMLELRDGTLTARRSWSGYWGRSDPPGPETISVQLDDAQIAEVIRAIESSALERAPSLESGRLDGPGNVETYELSLTLDGRRSHVRSVHRRSWKAAMPASPTHDTLQALARRLERLAPSKVAR
jgi:hypothetical protein